uniref:Uncharacterized protein n=1 Tax=Arundo donax TaxID=35708 RepID=A0A0A8ZYS0_ARUDO
MYLCIQRPGYSLCYLKKGINDTFFLVHWVDQNMYGQCMVKP